MRLVASHGKPASYPGIAQDFAHTFVVLNALPCDIFLGAHGMYFDMLAKLARMPQQGDSVWIDPTGYHAAIADRKAAFEKELATYAANMPSLQPHSGKFVLIKGEQVVSIFDTYADALKVGYERFKLEPFLVKQIAPAERVLQFTRDLATV